MRPELPSAESPEPTLRGATLPCLHAVTEGTGWLLPASSIAAVINKPMVQSISTSHLVDQLVVHGSKVVSAMTLARVWRTDSTLSDDEQYGWGLLVGPMGSQVVFLVHDLLGTLEVRTSDVEWLEAGKDEPLLGVVERDGQALLLVDPSRSPLFGADAATEDEYPWFDLRRLSSQGDQQPDTGGSRVQLVVLEDAGLGFAVPAHTVFDVRRGPESIEECQAPRLSAAIGGFAGDAPLGERGHPAFWCRIGSPASAVAVSFEKLLGWHLADDSRIRPWAAMEQFSAQGAFVLSGNGQVVVVVDPERLLALNSRQATPFAVTHPNNMGAQYEKMSTDPSKHLVRMRVGGEDVAVFMSAIRFVASLRKSHIHKLVTSQPAIVGVLNQTDAFSTIVDLGQLLMAEAIPRAPSSRLVTVEAAGSTVTLLVESVAEPIEVDSAGVEEWSGEKNSRLPKRFVAHGLRCGDGGLVPLLDLAEVVAEVTRTGAHE